MRDLCIAILVMMLASTLAPKAADAESYRYVRWVGLERLTIEPPVGHSSKGRIVVADDAFFQTDFCEDADDYYCFRSAQHAFAVPKVIGSNTKEWTVRGVRYELIERNVSISVFGRKIDGLSVMRSPANVTAAGNKPWLYLYSPRDGLVAFGSEDLRSTYWLEGDVGFGAAATRSSSAQHLIEHLP
jgi:hypothetical protein